MFDECYEHHVAGWETKGLYVVSVLRRCATGRKGAATQRPKTYRVERPGRAGAAKSSSGRRGAQTKQRRIELSVAKNSPPTGVNWQLKPKPRQTRARLVHVPREGRLSPNIAACSAFCSSHLSKQKEDRSFGAGRPRVTEPGGCWFPFLASLRGFGCLGPRSWEEFGGGWFPREVRH